MTSEEKLKNFQERIENIKQQRVTKQTQKEMLSTQYEEGVEELRKLGITDLSDIDSKITQLQQQIQTLEGSLEDSLTALENVLNLNMS